MSSTAGWRKRISNLSIVAGRKGAVIWDETGKKYLDFSSQLFNVNIGHQHPKVIAAIKDQADKLCYIGPGPANETRAELCRMLAEITPGDLVKTFLSTGGGTANENAIKIAKALYRKAKNHLPVAILPWGHLRSHVDHRRSEKAAQ